MWISCFGRTLYYSPRTAAARGDSFSLHSRARAIAYTYYVVINTLGCSVVVRSIIFPLCAYNKYNKNKWHIRTRFAEGKRQDRLWWVTWKSSCFQTDYIQFRKKILLIIFFLYSFEPKTWHASLGNTTTHAQNSAHTHTGFRDGSFVFFLLFLAIFGHPNRPGVWMFTFSMVPKRFFFFFCPSFRFIIIEVFLEMSTSQKRVEIRTILRYYNIIS